ncbi:MAG TPA: DUF2092 domain-containing protein [Isosphaeraceae bacterium]|nr:DUF2092 domain-containing protein [Isosphaeraceae bacterium]
MSPNRPVPPPQDDLIDRAAEALRRTPVPEGPSESIVTQTLTALRAAAGEPDIVPFRRRTTMMTALKIAGAVLASAGGLLYFAGLPPASATAEFTEAARKLQDAQTLSLRETMTIAGQANPATARLFYKVPGLMRAEEEPAGGAVSILDLSRGKVLFLNPADKSAILLEEPPAQGEGGGPGPRRDLAASMIDEMRRLGGKEGQAAGEKVIGNVRTRGYRVKEQGQDLTVWVDPQKKLPVQIEISGRTGNRDFQATFADIRLDPVLDDALFSFDPPAGYALRKAGTKLMMTPEEAVVRRLRTYADAHDGRFPARLDDFTDSQKPASTKKPKGAVEPGAFEVAIAAAHVAAFCQKMKDHYGYKPEGVKLGDARTILFWYQPEGQTRYRAVYGDLHVGDVSADQLPEKPKP